MISVLIISSEFKFTMAEVDVTPEMRKRGMMLCQQFLGGTWARVKDEDFEIERIRYE